LAVTSGKPPFLKLFLDLDGLRIPPSPLQQEKMPGASFFVEKISMERNVVFIIRSFMYDS
ncbi:MAG: hypothetical protein IKF93_03070, partial [Lachnospiraceae bacterium]|nr:hypothetical protein [Lachnospiraceae bacterium]